MGTRDREQEYFKEWYERNADQYNRKRQARYRTDPEYRQRQRENALRQLEKDRDPNPQVREFGGRKVLVYTTRQVGDRLGVQGKTVRAWITSGAIPQTLQSPGGHNFFTEHQVSMLEEYLAAMADAPARSKRREESWRHMRELLDRSWNRGVEDLL